ncbi:MAG: hypothetical protein ACLQBB_16090 [Solirubrobacteraceae bacterium]
MRILIVAVAVLGGTALLVQQGGATVAAPTNHKCPLVSTLNGFKRTPAIRSFTHDVPCSEALGIVRAMVSGVGVTFVGNPEGGAYQFRWKLYGFPGWTCFGDGSGFPEGGAGGDCSRGSASVAWYHAN